MFFSFINLWCTKNLVDTQFLLGKILEKRSNEFYYCVDPFSNEVELVFLNTCWFISSWREEMFATIKKLLRKKKKICLLWCAVQYFQKLGKENKLNDDENKLRKETIQNDNIYFLSRKEINWFKPALLKNRTKKRINYDFERPENSRAYTNIDLWYEYIKIAEWCNNQCSFCIIPKIRWKQSSLPIETIIAETKNLIKNWVKEIILIAQDSTRYGIDNYWKPMLLELLEQIDKIKWDFRYRVLYLYPDILTKKHLEKLTKLKKFIPYFDIPLQHSSPKILKSMWRFYNHEMTLELLNFIKNNFKEYYIRTNFIIWFPWETEEDFSLLLNFIEQDRFNNIALFEYHDEILAPSHKLPNKIEKKIIRERFKKAKELVNKLQNKRKKHEHWTKKGIITDIWQDKKWNFNLSVRPLLHCPEIDEEDEIKIDNITKSFEGDTINTWNIIEYKI